MLGKKGNVSESLTGSSKNLDCHPLTVFSTLTIQWSNKEKSLSLNNAFLANEKFGKPHAHSLQISLRFHEFLHFLEAEI